MIKKIKIMFAVLSAATMLFLPSLVLATGNQSGLANDPTVGNGCSNAGGNEQKCLSNNQFITDIRDIVNIVSGLVGIIVVAMVILGGIQYSLARDNSGEIGAAQKRIANAVIALVLYMLIFGFLQWLIPGGLFA